jgi:hypothetical protein
MCSVSRLNSLPLQHHANSYQSGKVATLFISVQISNICSSYHYTYFHLLIFNVVNIIEEAHNQKIWE